MILEYFSHPEWFEAALAVALVTAVALLTARAIARRRRMRLVGSLAAPPTPQWVSDLALLVALVAMLVAVLGPRVGERMLRLSGSGVDVVILLDVSRSMDARDVPPSRLDRARRIAAEVLLRLDARDRVALAAFADRGVLLSPLTPDRAALAEVLSALDTGLIHPAGSDLGRGVGTALEAFAEGSARPRVVLVLGDGEDPEGRSEVSSGALRRMNARVIAAAIGSEAGSTIPDGGAALRDRNGDVVVTRRRASRLERITSASGGELFLADEWGRIDSDALLAALRRDAGTISGEPVERRVAAVRVVPFAALAFALLLVEGLPRPRIGRRLGLAAALLALPLMGASSGPATGVATAAAEIDPRALVQLGLERLERGEQGAAARAFEAAAITAGDPSLAALAYYDLAITALERGDLEAARDAFFDALALAPRDERARFNLEWTLQALAATPPLPAEPATAPAPDRPPKLSDSSEAERQPSPSADDSLEQDGSVQLEAGPRRAKPPDVATRKRWIERVEDDLARAVQGASRQQHDIRGAGPAW